MRSERLSKSSSKAPQQVKEKADIKTWIGFIVLILGFLLSLCVYVSNQKAKPLVYRMLQHSLLFLSFSHDCTFIMIIAPIIFNCEW